MSAFAGESGRFGLARRGLLWVQEQTRCGDARFAFLSQGGRLEHETTGYVCTGYFGTASIHDGPLDPDEDLDWD